MANNPEVLQNITDKQDQTGQVQTTRLQNEPVQNSTAQTGGTVIAPLLHGSVFHGPVNISFGADFTHRGGDRSEKETGKTAAASSTAAQIGVSVSDLTAAKEDGGVKDALKRHFVAKFAKLYDRTSLEGSNLLLKDIYTELYVIEGCTGGVNTKHEVRRIECFYPKIEETSIKFSDIFKTQSSQNVLGTKVLTLGIAGVGKTASVHKFILDWAEDTCNQDLDFILFFPFRELNVIKEEKYSLWSLLLYFHDEFHNADVNEILTDKCKVVFILDGLDESKLNLDFNQKKLSNVTEETTIDKLLTNLIKGELLPSALIWITTRPAAAKQIPQKYFHHVTEIRGFNDPQKEEYFRKRIRDEDQASRIISHIKTVRSLHILCHIPVFCSISATVLQEVLKDDKDMKNAPTTLTEMYTRFLLFHTRINSEKYSIMQNDRLGVEGVLKLGKLAFLQLQKGQLIFYENDLQECGIDVDEAVVYSGVCTQIFKKDEKIFCFVHLSYQEFLAAVFVFLTFSHECNPLLQTIGEKIKWKLKHTLGDLLKTAVDKAMKSDNGHLDLFLRFLCGLCLESNQRLLKSLQGVMDIKEVSLKAIVDYIKRKIKMKKHFEKSTNLFHCLSELKDNSLTTEIQEYLNSGNLSTQKLSSTQWSALVFVLLMSEETQEKFELKKYRPSEEGLRRLLPVVKNTRRALLDHCNLGGSICEALASMWSSDSPLKELDLSNNDLQDSGVKLLSAGLMSSHCKLEILRLDHCNLGGSICEALASMWSSDSPLKELDLSNNDLQDSGVKLLSAGLMSSHCKLEILRLDHCNLGGSICEALASMWSSDSPLKELDLSNNDLQDSGVELLSAGLMSSHCKLEILRLSGCMITEKGCSSLGSALSSNPSHLNELDLTYNHPGESGVKLLSARLGDPHCSLSTLRVEHGGENRIKPGPKKYSCDLTLDPNTVNSYLSLSDGNRKVEFVGSSQSYPDHPERFNMWPQVLCTESLTGHCYWEAEWSGMVHIAVTYKSISRKGNSPDCQFGGNVKSWNLICSNNRYSVCHNNNSTDLSAHPSSSGTVGVYLDCPAGSLSFYRVSTDKLTHLHTFNTTFTEPLCTGFGVGCDSSVCLK
ncbi:NACHT, LRR and PYD domains-containing protein 12-like isoform X2 [Colossoma macropomum]|uniref:NACHT, LRR and PYD domains-containing protein 12-like isoform X2 n=1 Tax=Colossoma macropomum TaxID=42526 RepID=UPI001863B689|nr:NACHT, LRR and PYD domains-containing protein 12-like isoform X2 [Colossoma macropomum]